MKHKFWLLNPYFNADSEGASGGSNTGGDPAGSSGEAKSPESVLFPKEGGKPGSAEDKGAEGGSTGEDGRPAGDDSEGDDKGGDEKDGKGDDPLDQVPEDGKYQLTMPEGVELDTELLEAIGAEFKEFGLTHKQAQKLADKFTAIQQKRAEKFAKEPEGAWSAVAYEFYKKNGTPDRWLDDAKADKEIGGDNWERTTQNAVRFVNAYATDRLKEFLDASGGGNHPEIIRIFAKAGELIREDNPASGGAAGKGKPADPAHVLFPNDAPKG